MSTNENAVIEEDDGIDLKVTVTFTHRVHKRYFELALDSHPARDVTQEVCLEVATELQDNFDALGAVLTEHDGELTVNVEPAKERDLT